MTQFVTIFTDFKLPNAVTWFYLSLILAIGLFFKFNRVFSVRNFDVLSLFLLVPGFLLLQESREIHESAPKLRMLFGFIWLMVGSLCFFARCLLDLTLVARPVLNPNLNLAGLAWLAAALFACMVPVAARLPEELQQTVGKRSVAFDALDNLGSKAMTEAQERLVPDEARDEELIRFWVGRSIALSCHLAVVAALVLIGATHFQNTTSGMAAATCYLLLPYTAYHLGQAHHVFPAALLIWTVFCYRRPAIAGLLLGFASGSCFFPALTLPIWMSFYRSGGWRRFLLMFGIAAGLSLGLTGLVLWWDGKLADGLQLALSQSRWKAWVVADSDSLWQGVHAAYRLPVIVIYIAFVVMTSFWPSPKNLAHVVSLCAAVLIGIQFWYADQGGVYVLWYLPLLVLMIFRPNLADRFALPAPTAPMWPVRLARRMTAWSGTQIHGPQPIAKV
jgi:hypothetical protein